MIKYLRKTTYKMKRYNLSHSFSPWLLGPVGFGAVVKQHIMVGNMWQKK
jgi:hypothetical protein